MKKQILLIFGFLIIFSCGPKISMALHPERLVLGMSKSPWRAFPKRAHLHKAFSMRH